MSIGIIRKLAAASVFALAATASQAAVVESWDFVLTMNWSTSTNSYGFDRGYLPNHGGYGPGKRVVTSTEVSWGGTGTLGKFYPIQSYPSIWGRSGIVITQPNIAGNIKTSIEGESSFSVQANMFTHYNAGVSPSHDTLRYATMNVDVQVVHPDTGEVVATVPKTFKVYFLETRTTYTNPPPPMSDPDIFAVLSDMDFTESFLYGGVEYTLNYFEMPDNLKKLSNNLCGQVVKTNSPCYGFTTAENTSTAIKFNFSITAAPTAIPEPETYAMMLAGLGLIGVVARRRRNAISK
ncbi:MAG: THxN family PEP-CTERM protein [Azoarcus sp.]|jgi:hypothetical protein|nr:THxN family PEP-CTERM protein [Azoarcus sp.]